MDATKNFARSLVATAPSPANSGTSLVVTAGEGSLFPTVPFNAVIAPANALPLSNNSEIVRVTARSTDTLTITRSQEGSSARTIAVGDQLFVGVTAKVLTDLDAGSTGAFSVNGLLSATTMQLGGDGGVWSRIVAGLTQYAGNLLLTVNPRNAFALSVSSPDNPGGSGAAFLIRGDGKMEWSNGDQIFDVSLYRPTANWLQIDGSLWLATRSSALPSLVVKAAASQTANIQEWQNSAGAVLAYIRNDGSLYTGNVLGAPNFDIRGAGDIYLSTGDPAGTVNLRNFNGPVSLSVLPNMHVALWNSILEFGPYPTSDTFLQRQSANNLATPGSFWAGNSIILDTNNAGAKIYWGSALDAALYRSAPFTLKANASLLVDGAVYVNSARNANPAFRIYDMGAGGGSVMDTYCEFIWPTRAVYHFSDQANAVFHELFIRGRGTIAAPLGLQAGDYLALYGWRGYYGPNQTDNLNHASIYVQTTETWTAAAMGATMTFYTTPAGQTGQVASMILNGNNTYTPLLQTDRLMNIGSIPSVPTAIVRAAAAQSADLQQWQASDASVVARVKMDSTTGVLVETDRGELILGQTGATYGATRLTITNRGGLNGAMFEQLGSVDLIDFVFRTLTVFRNIRLEGRGSSANYFGTPEFQIGIPGDPALCVYDTGIGIRAPLATSVPLMVKGFAGQTADLQQWQNSAGALLAKIDKSGTFFSRANAAPADASMNTNDMALWFDPTNGAAKLMVKAKQADGTVKTGVVLLDGAASVSVTPTVSARNVVQPTAATVMPLIVKAFTGQSADLQQWQDSTGTALAWVDNLGKFRTNTGAVVITNDARLSDARMPIQQVVQAADITVNPSATSPANSTLTFAQSGTYYVLISWMSRHATNNGKYTFRFKWTGGTIQDWSDVEAGYTHTESYFRLVTVTAGQQIWTEFFNQDGSGALSIYNHQMIAIRVS